MAAVDSIRMIVLDVDGVLTDGGIYFDDAGQELKRFHVRDGFAIKRAMELGFALAVVTGRESRVVAHRMAELGVSHLIQNCKDKRAGIANVCDRSGLALHETAYLGDDLIDLPAMAVCGYPMAVADAVEEVRARAVYVTRTPGGAGAARDAIEHLLKEQGRWSQVLERYGIDGTSPEATP